MAGGKETPRQKMIGMMYLVLTALLAMNVSKQILHGYIVVNESMEESKKNLTENNKRITESFESTINGNPAAKPYFEKAKQAQAMLTELGKYIDEVKFNVIAKTEKYENPKSGDTAQLKYLESTGSIDNYDIPSHELIGSDAATPENKPLSALELKDKMTKLHASLVSMLDDMQKNPKTKLLPDDYEGLKKKLGALKPVDSGAEDDGLKMTWEVENFYHLPMAAVVTNLNKMQAELKNIEAELLQVFSGASGKLAIKFDRLTAKVIAPSSYIQAGQPYKADIFLAASSSAMTADMMQVLVGADSASGQGGSPVPIEGGMGKYEVGTGGQGEQTYKGIIKFKKPDGTFDNYPFQASYMVAAPAVAVAAEKMNVIYIGVDNPMSINAAGVSPTDLLVNLSGCGATKTGGQGGKFIFRATSPGTLMVSVSAKTKDGTKPQGKPIPFRVKKIPDPTPKLGGNLVQGIADVKKINLAAIAGVGAEVPGFDFDVKFPVMSFIFSANVKGTLKEFNCNGPNLSPEAKSVLQSLGVGGKAYFEDIKVKAPDGSIRKIATASLKVK
jgi:gliding motility-associated protein GldM